MECCNCYHQLDEDEDECCRNCLQNQEWDDSPVSLTDGVVELGEDEYDEEAGDDVTHEELQQYKEEFGIEDESPDGEHAGDPYKF